MTKKSSMTNKKKNAWKNVKAVKKWNRQNNSYWFKLIKRLKKFDTEKDV